MKYIRFILIAIVAIFLVYFFFVVNRDIEEDSAQSPNQQKQTGQNSLESKTDGQGQVTIKVTPQTLSGTQWKFDLVFNTHSVDLNQDVMQIAELVDSQGNVYKPTAWEGAGAGGHHREGVLIFKAVNPAPSYVELKIKDVGGVPERSFKWNLK